MDFKNILNSLSQLSEASMADIKGKKHTGKYGTEYQGDDDEDDTSKKAEPAEKKGRGRPKKDSTVDAGKWKGADDAASAVIGGKTPSSATKGTKHGFTAKEKEAKKVEKKSKKLKEDEENSFVCVHAKKGKCEVKAKTSYEAAKKAADKWKLKSTAGIDTHRADKPVHVDETELKGNQKKLDVAEPKGKLDAKDFAALRSKKKLKDWIEHLEVNQQLNEAEEVTIMPAQQDTQLIKQGTKTLGTVTNPQLAAQIKQSLGKGEMSLAGDELDEDQTDEGLGDMFGKAKQFVKHNVLGTAGGRKADFQKFLKAKEAEGAIASGVSQKLLRQFDIMANKGADTDYLGKNIWNKFSQGVSGVREGMTPNTDPNARYNEPHTWPKGAKPGHYNTDTKQVTAWDYRTDSEREKSWGSMIEVAPPGAKAERMVKHIKAGYAKDGKLTPKEKSIAFATAWKAKKAGKVEEESMIGQDVLSPKEKLAPHAGIGKGKIQQKLGQAGVIAKNIGRFLKGKPEIPTMEGVTLEDGTILTEGDIKRRLNTFLDELTAGAGKFNINTAVELSDKAMANRIIDRTLQHGMFKHLPGTMKGQMRDFALEEFGFTDYNQSLEEDDPVLPKLLQKPKMDEPSVFKKTGTMSPTPDVSQSTPFNAGTPTQDTGSFLSSLRKTAPRLESEDMKDVQFESWEKQLNAVLNEGLTISSSSGQQGSPDSVTISATDSDAQELLNIVRSAGLGVFGGGEQHAAEPEGHVSALMSVPSEEADGSGTDPESSPEVVDDGDGMMSLLKKMSGLGQEARPSVTHDYEEEDSDEEESQKDESDEEVEEGNAFTEKLKQTPQGEEFELNGKKYKDTSNVEESEDLDDEMNEGYEESCNECGMYESKCDCEQVDEGFANDAGEDGTADAELMKLKALLSMGNDLHKMKHDQTVGNPTRVSVKESLNEWKKLSGIK